MVKDEKLEVAGFIICPMCLNSKLVTMIHQNKKAPVLNYYISVLCPRCK
jgi:hypothetical protein